MWQSRPVFISSTFADMQAERDYLRSHVFPELEERLRKRRHNLEWVDLRVGVATSSHDDEHVRELHVLKVCLDEVRRCRPFLIVLLGDRYGWVPPENRIKTAAEEARKGFSADVAGRSVTDLEIDFGVLSDPEQQARSFFYFRDPLPYPAMPPETAALYCEDYASDPAKADRKQRLARLKRRVEDQLPTRIRHYTALWNAAQHRVGGLEDFGRMVLEDVWSELDSESMGFAAAPDISWQQAERNALDDFVDERARNFVGREGILRNVMATATGQGDLACGICITGDPGSGKSALFGELYRRLRASGVFLLAHAAGASIAAASTDAMLRRWIGELADALGMDPPALENAEPDKVEATFASLLGRMAQQRRVIVLIDALDQFEPTARAQYVTWLPQLWPENARLIVTAIAGKSSQALVNREGVLALPLPALDAGEASDIIAGICARYHRTFEPHVVDALLAKGGPNGPAWSNPLWLVIAVEELNLLDADDFDRARTYAGRPDEQLRALMLQHVDQFPNDIPRLYEHAFERAEKLFGASLARSFLGLIAVSRSGWREIDFRILLPRASGESWDELKFAQLRRLFRVQLRQRGALAQWDFNHAQMRIAVRARLAVAGIREQDLHRLIADRLLSCRPNDPLRAGETMVHLLASQDYERAARYYGDASLSASELQGATRVLADALIAPADGTASTAGYQLSQMLDGSDDSVRGTVAERLLFDLDNTIQQHARLHARSIVIELTERAFQRLHETDPENANWRRNLAVSYMKRADVQVAQGDLTGASTSYQNGLEITDRLAHSDRGNAQWQHDLAIFHGKLGDVQTERGRLAEALKSYGDKLAIMKRLTEMEPGNGSRQRDLSVAYTEIGRVRQAQGELAIALEAHGHGLAIMSGLAGSDPDNADLQRCLHVDYIHIGNVHAEQREYGEALKSYRDALRIAERQARADLGNADGQRAVLVSLSKIGDVQAAQGDRAGALKSYQTTLTLCERLAQSDPANAGWQRDLSISCMRLANVQEAQGDRAGRLQHCRKSLAIAERLAKADPTNMEWQFDLSCSFSNVGDALLALGDGPGALESYRDALAVARHLARHDAGNPGWQRALSISLNKIGDVQVKQGDPAGALGSYRESSDFFRRLAQSNPANPGWQRDLCLSLSRVGEVLLGRRDFAEALKSYNERLAISQRLLQSDPANLESQHYLSLSLAELGDAQLQQGDLAAALKSLRESVVISRRLVQSTPGNLGWQQDLSASLAKMGDAQLQQGDATGALSSLRDRVATLEALAAADPNHAVRQRDLSWAYEKLADVQKALGNPTEAMQSYRQSLNIRKRLAAGSNPQPQSDRAGAPGNS